MCVRFEMCDSVRLLFFFFFFFRDDQVIRGNAASRGTETSAELCLAFESLVCLSGAHLISLT